MRNLLTVLFLLIGSQAHSLDNAKCLEIASAAETDIARLMMLRVCSEEKSLLFRSKRFRCAKKILSAKREQDVKLLFAICIKK